MFQGCFDVLALRHLLPLQSSLTQICASTVLWTTPHLICYDANGDSNKSIRA